LGKSESNFFFERTAPSQSSDTFGAAILEAMATAARRGTLDLLEGIEKNQKIIGLF
jgi:hypothetical protein